MLLFSVVFRFVMLKSSMHPRLHCRAAGGMLRKRVRLILRFRSEPCLKPSTVFDAPRQRESDPKSVQCPIRRAASLAGRPVRKPVTRMSCASRRGTERPGFADGGVEPFSMAKSKNQRDTCWKGDERRWAPTGDREPEADKYRVRRVCERCRGALD